MKPPYLRASARDFWNNIASYAPPDLTGTLHIGTDRDAGDDVNLDIDGLFDGEGRSHMFVSGGSSTGKTKFLELVARGLVERVRDDDWTLILLDGKGGTLHSLSDDVFAATVEAELDPDRVAFVNPHDSDRLPGLNFFDPIGGAHPATIAERTVENFNAAFGETESYRPWLSEWLMCASLALIREGFTPVELEAFASVADPRFRNAVLANLKDPLLTRMWAELSAFKPAEQADRLGALKTRSKQLLYNERVMGMLGQKRGSIGWEAAMNNGGAVIVKLGSGPNLTESAGNFLGRGIVHQIIDAALGRRQQNAKPVVVMVDEFERFVSKDFNRGLDWLRGYGLTFALASQNLGQLRADAPQLLESVMSNCLTKAVFRSSRRDAEELAGELYGHFGEDRIIETMQSPYLVPHEETRTIETHTESYAESDSESESDVSSHSVGETSYMNPDGQLITIDTDTSGTGSGTSSGHSTTRGSGTSTAVVPWLRHELKWNPSSRRAWSAEQLREQSIASITEQDQRECILKTPRRELVRLRTATVQPVAVSGGDLAEARLAAYNKFDTIDRAVCEIRDRVPIYLDQADTDPNDDVDPVRPRRSSLGGRKNKK